MFDTGPATLVDEISVWSIINVLYYFSTYTDHRSTSDPINKSTRCSDAATAVEIIIVIVTTAAAPAAAAAAAAASVGFGKNYGAVWLFWRGRRRTVFA